MLSFDASRALRMLRAIARYLTGPEPLELAGKRGLEASRRAFATESDPVTGRRWRPLRPATAAAKGSNIILHETGAMEGSFRLGAPNNLFRFAGKRRLLSGSTDPKAPFHQYGTGRGIPVRRMAGMSTADLAAVTKAIVLQAAREAKRA